MPSQRNSLNAFSIAVPLCLTCIFSVGCSNSLTSLTALPIPGQANATSAAVPGGHCSVEIRGLGKPKLETVQVTSETRVQNVIEQTRGAKFRRLKAHILRPSTYKPGETVKLVSNFDPKKGKITWETDYAVLPGDKVVIARDTTTAFDRAVGGILPQLK